LIENINILPVKVHFTTYFPEAFINFAATNMKFLLRLSQRLLLQILLLLLCYFISRAAFTFINRDHFASITVAEFFRLAFYGTRFDVSALLLTNVLYFFLVLLPLPLWKMPEWEKVTHWIFVIGNATVFLFELSDWAYFPFNHKRSTADVLDMVTRKGDFFTLLPTFVIDYWYVPVAWIILVFLLHVANKRIAKSAPITAPAVKSGVLVFFFQFLYMCAFVLFMVYAIRGGTQMKPIVLTDAVKYTDNEHVPIVLNTPFSIINSLQNDKLPELHYVSDEEARTYIDPVKKYKRVKAGRTNVVVIILESFSKEFTSLGRSQSCTPFLDSLMTVSLNCTDAYANALRSAEGIPAIISGIPSLMEEPITTSVYGNNRITAMPNLLRSLGYSSAFYHGGTNGTMSFDIFCANAGYDKYYGRTEYNNEKDYDGNWGIWDEPYLQYFADGINKMQQPFLATVFTLSSHPPYKLPKQYEGVLPQRSSPIEAVVSYSDMALGKFFATASKQPWFNNTLFVITADHTAMVSQKKRYGSKYMELYAIPFLLYAPGDSTLRGIYNKPVQQIDILPTVMDYVGYSKSFFSFGSSIFSDDKRFVVNAISGSYQLYKDGYLLLSNNDMKPRALYAYPADTNCKYNLLRSNMAIAKERNLFLKTFRQQYNNSLNRNKMWIPL
jgi:phosphoglycerol transferase MdoB-like AlkP superfamily enzyme